VYAVALAIVGSRDAAEDVAQQTFERVWRRCSTFDPGRGTVRTWINTVTRNVALDSLKAIRAQPVSPENLIRLAGVSSDEPDVLSIRQESWARLRRALGELPSDQCRAVVMAAAYRLTAQEIADVDGIPLGTAKTRIRLGLRKLRECLSTPEVINDRADLL
jgi:RNA polymerase sigma-70 factor (ECF subfamily)